MQQGTTLEVRSTEITVRPEQLRELSEQTPDEKSAWAGLAAALQAELDGKATLAPDSPVSFLLRDGVGNDGTQGFAFEYTVHAGLQMDHASVAPFIREGIHEMGYGGGSLQSLLFIPDRSGAFTLDSTALRRADGARVITGGRGRPPGLTDDFLTVLKTAALARGESGNLPVAAPDLWRADLFISGDDGLRWVATDVKSNPKKVRPRQGLPLVVIPGPAPRVYRDGGRVFVQLPLSGRGYGIWEDGVRRLELAKQLTQDAGRFKRLIAGIDQPAVRWLLGAKDRPLGEVIGEAWTRAGVDEPLLLARSRVHTAELVVPRQREIFVPQTLRVA